MHYLKPNAEVSSPTIASQSIADPSLEVVTVFCHTIRLCSTLLLRSQIRLCILNQPLSTTVHQRPTAITYTPFDTQLISSVFSGTPSETFASPGMNLTCSQNGVVHCDCSFTSIVRNMMLLTETKPTITMSTSCQRSTSTTAYSLVPILAPTLFTSLAASLTPTPSIALTTQAEEDRSPWNSSTSVTNQSA